MTTSEPTGEAPFATEVFLNKYLEANTGAVDAIVTVTAAGTVSPATGEPGELEETGAAAEGRIAGRSDQAEVVIIDHSGSMYPHRKMQQARDAAAAAVDCLDEGVAFAVIAGNHRSQMVYPSEERLAPATEETRGAARSAIGRLQAEGGTAIGAWLDLARELFDSTRAPARHATLLTDGINQSQGPDDLTVAIEASQQVFQCDGVGIGTDWDVEELRRITHGLQGSFEFIRDLEDLVGHFRSVISVSQSRIFPDVKLRLWTPKGATVESVRQAAPEVTDLTAGAVPYDEMTSDFLLGGWAPGETRDYHLRIQVPPQEAGERGLGGHVALVLVNGEVTPEVPIEVEWTDDLGLSTQIESHVAHYAERAKLTGSIQLGTKALREGDEETATAQLGRAVQIAKDLGDDEALGWLYQVVEEDPRTGAVRLRKDRDKGDEMDLDTKSTRTTRLPKASREEQEEGGEDDQKPEDDQDDSRDDS